MSSNVPTPSSGSVTSAPKRRTSSGTSRNVRNKVIPTGGSSRSFVLRINKDRLVRYIKTGRLDANPDFKRAAIRAVFEIKDDLMTLSYHRNRYGRWVVNVYGSNGFIRHPTSRTLANVEVPSDYILSPLNFVREMRHYVLGLDYDDWDIKACHQVLLQAFCRVWKLETPILDDYLANREEKYLQPVADMIPSDVPRDAARDLAKMLFLRVTYGGSWVGFAKDCKKDVTDKRTGKLIHKGFKLGAPCTCVTNYEDEMRSIFQKFPAEMGNRYHDIAVFLNNKPVPPQCFNAKTWDWGRLDHAETLGASVLSTHLQDVEFHIVDECMKMIPEPLLGLYEYDGFHVRKGSIITAEHLQKSTVDTGIRFGVNLGSVVWEKKQMNVPTEYDAIDPEVPLAWKEELEAQIEDDAEYDTEALKKLPEVIQNIIVLWLTGDPKGPRVTDTGCARVYGELHKDIATNGNRFFRIDDISGRYIEFESKEAAIDIVGNKVRDAVVSVLASIKLRCLPLLKLNYFENGNFRTRCGKEAFALPQNIDSDLTKKLDTNTNVIGFDNGVIDLDEAVSAYKEGRPFAVRKARPDEYVAKSCGYDYRFIPRHEATEDNPADPEMDEITSVIMKMFVAKSPDGGIDTDDDAGCDTVTKLLAQLASALRRGNRHQVAQFFVGIGANGKSVLMNLLKLALGQYVVHVNQKFWSEPLPCANTPAPLVCAMRNAMFYLTSELDQDSKINSGLFKALVTCDPVEVRNLYEKILYLCEWGARALFGINDMPKFTDRDAGFAAIRRITATNFPFVFVPGDKYKGLEELGKGLENSDFKAEAGPFVRLADEQLTDRVHLKKLGVSFFNLLLHVFCQYETTGCKFETSEQQDAYTKEVHGTIDIISPWASTYIKRAGPDDFVLTEELFENFVTRTYISDEENRLKPKEFAERFAKIAKFNGWKAAPNMRSGLRYNHETGAVETYVDKGIIKNNTKKGRGYNGIRLDFSDLV